MKSDSSLTYLVHNMGEEHSMGVYRFRRGCGGRISGRRRLTAIKRARYKSNNDNYYQPMAVAA